MLPRNLNKITKSSVNHEQTKHRLIECLFILVLAASVFLLLALMSYQRTDPGWSHAAIVYKKVRNLGGYVGAWLADIFFCAFGYIAYLLPFMFTYVAWISCCKEPKNSEKDSLAFIFRFASFLLLLLTTSSLARLYVANAGRLPFNTGGIIGDLFSSALLRFCHATGTNLILFALLFSSLTLFTGISWLKLAERVGKIAAKIFDFCGQGIKISIRKLMANCRERKKTSKIDAGALQAKRGLFQEDEAMEAKIAKEYITELLKNSPCCSNAKSPLINKVNVIQPSSRSLEEKQSTLFDPNLAGSLPPLALLDLATNATQQNYSDTQLAELSRKVEIKLRDFGIDAKVEAVYPGPVVTRFELQLSAGTKVSKITVLAKDLARSLSVTSVRVVEIIPGKSVIGLELPNEYREIVRLREILASKQYEIAHAPLNIALGKDISGHPVIVDLAKMPHLLVAGTTGSGKSVCLNTMLVSLLYKYTMQEMRLILIDPKMLELSVYNGIPHLLVPVVTDMKDAASALRWCVYEMERRYKILATLGVRNVGGYNHKIKEARAKGAPLLDPLWKEGGAEIEPKELQELPYIVVIADEYADMFMVVGKKIEELITRIAQKARAAGIHLVLATQRPSVDVITGLIKANISTRIAFQVSSKIDSRTILDQSGAEQLLGFGDMLYLPPGSGVPIRVHGAYVSDEEVHKVVCDLQRRAEPEYIEEILNSADLDLGDGPSNQRSGDDASFDNLDNETDPLYDQAVNIVIETRRTSISQIQRRLRIGYNRAARMVEAMERAGLVGPMEANGSREILITGRAE